MDATDDFEGWLRAVKTARVLDEWVDGVPADRLVDDYRIAPGDLEARIERVGWVLGAAAALAGVLGVDLPRLERVRSAFADAAAGPGPEGETSTGAGGAPAAGDAAGDEDD